MTKPWTWLQLLSLTMVCALVFLIGVACDQGEYHKAADAAAKVSSSLKAAVSESEALYRAGAIGKDEFVNLLVELDHAAYVNDEYVRQLRSFKTIDATNRSVLVNWIGDMTRSVDSLNANGVLHVKNAESQQKLAVYVTALRGSIQILGALLGATPAKTSTTVNPTQTAAFAYGG